MLKSGLASAVATIFFCGFFGGVILFFGGGLLLGTLGVLPIFGNFNNWIFFSFIFGGIAGGFFGYVIYQKFKEKD
jgi:hypothetical protein